MGFSKRKKVAIFICGNMVDYQTQIISQLSDEMTRNGYYTIIYLWFGGYGHTPEFEAGELNAAYLPEYSEYDGIFLCLDTFTNPEASEEVLNMVKRHSHCPVICIRREADRYHTILIDDENSMEPMIRHLVEDHHFKDIFYVSGIEGHPDAVKRLVCVKRVLAGYGMELKDENLIHGDFWRNSGGIIADTIIERRQGKLPEAIVCANDYMAIAVCHALQERGYEIPRDTVVTGFDDISEVSYTIPSITSVKVDLKEMAMAATRMFLSLVAGEKVDRIDYVSATVVPRQSCGCMASSTKTLTDAVRNYYEAWSQLRHEFLESCFISLDTEIAQNIEELNQSIDHYMGINANYKDFFVVLNDYDWAAIKNEEMKGYTDNVRVRTAFLNNVLQKKVDILIPRREILPDEFINDEPGAYYVIPLHFHKASFGYSVINYFPGGRMGGFYEFMLISICNALEHMRSAKRNEVLIEKLSSMYVTDVLTGLKNRYGFELETHRMYDLVQTENRTMAIIGLDMDGLKVINDNFGHPEGDYALCILADAIRAATFSDEIGFRVGGDEFQVLALDYSENSIQKFLKRFNAYLDEFNRTSTKPYNVLASYGYCICNATIGFTLTEWLAKSDDRMYAMKEKNKATRTILKNQK